ncbi:MAG TPA: ribosome-associated translation inhibitor RaiA [Candidatus Saccharibacteria bacterium]|nr:ribosome-associated translation inhibitor RaiA [Candidatus Saccharibacteria bacterium]
MIQKMEVQGINLKVDNDLQKYVEKKLGRLDKYMPRHSRESAHMVVHLKERVIKTKKECTCEVIIKLPKETIATKEATINIYAAVDIVETKLKNQLKKYKDKNTDHKVSKKILAKLRSRKTR